MTPADLFVRWRDGALDRLLGVRGRVLNMTHPPGASRGGADIAANLKDSITEVVAAAGGANDSRLDYDRLAASPSYREYRARSATLTTVDLTRLGGREARVAFWINLYNARVIDAVIAFGARRSVTDGPLGILAFFRRAAYMIGGRRFSCDDIEHGILRGNRGHPFIPGPQFGPADPRLAFVVRPPEVRVHFALNCASRSCPPIRVYDAEQIDRQLDFAARSFIETDTEVGPSRGTVRVSRIFGWFARDFGGRAGVLATLRRYLPDDDRRRWLEANENKARVVYRRYDWGLNAVVPG